MPNTPVSKIAFADLEQRREHLKASIVALAAKCELARSQRRYKVARTHSDEATRLAHVLALTL